MYNEMTPNGPILVTGSAGQLGNALLKLNPTLQGVTRSEMDLNSKDSVISALEDYDPRGVINCAAYNLVNQAEQDSNTAHQLNGVAPGWIADWCKKNNRFLIHFSTDAVFSGAGVRPWSETDSVSPLNEYAKSKLEGERAISRSNCRSLILRTSWVYDAINDNFFTKMARLTRSKSELTVIDNQFGSMTYALDLAVATLELTNRLENGGIDDSILHVAGSGYASWMEIAKCISELVGESSVTKWIPISLDAYQAENDISVPRGLNSRLDCRLAKTKYGIELPDWRDAIQRAIEQLSA